MQNTPRAQCGRGVLFCVRHRKTRFQAACIPYRRIHTTLISVGYTLAAYAFPIEGSLKTIRLFPLPFYQILTIQPVQPHKDKSRKQRGRTNGNKGAVEK